MFNRGHATTRSITVGLRCGRKLNRDRDQVARILPYLLSFQQGSPEATPPLLDTSISHSQQYSTFFVPMPVMARQSLLYAFLSLAFFSLSWALKFDLAAHTGRERCIRNFVAKDTLVLVTAIVDGQKGDGQQVNMHVSLPVAPIACRDTSADATLLLQIKDAVGNEYGRPKDIVGETRMAFTSHADAAFDVCFENQLISFRKHCPQIRT